MKTFLITFSLVLFNVSLFGQSALEWEEVVEVNGATKDELFNRARTWYSDTYNDEGEVISISDKEIGEISGNATMKYNAKSFASKLCISGYIDYKINIYLKEGKYKYKFHSLVHEGSQCDSAPINYGLLTDSEDHKRSKKEWDNMKEKSKVYMEELIESLKKAMNKPSEKSDNW